MSNSDTDANMYRGVSNCNAIVDSYWSELFDSDDDAHAIVHPDIIADSYWGGIFYWDADSIAHAYSVTHRDGGVQSLLQHNIGYCE